MSTYNISSINELTEFANEVNSGFDYAGDTICLDKDIDAHGINWIAIGNIDVPFQGTFDGNNYEIYNIKIISKKSNNGFFGCLGANSLVENLKLSGNIISTPTDNALGIAAGANWGKISNCNCNIVIDINKNGTSDILTGGIVGINQTEALIENCAADVKINIISESEYSYKNHLRDNNQPFMYIGGIAGQNCATITSCTANISIDISKHSRNGFCIGGIVGENVYDANISRCCFEKGEIYSSDMVASIAEINNGNILDCTALGTLSIDVYDIGKCATALEGIGSVSNSSDKGKVKITFCSENAKTLVQSGGSVTIHVSTTVQ